MLTAIRTEDLADLDTNLHPDIALLFPISRDVPSSLVTDLTSRFTADELVSVSEAFVDERNRVLGKLSPTRLDGAIRILFFPSAEPWPRSIHRDGANVVLIPAGFVDLMRSHAIASVWSTQIRATEGISEETLQNVAAAEQYLNLRSILFLWRRRPLVDLDKFVTERVRAGGYRVAEAAILFAVLHECGHQRFSMIGPRELRQFVASLEDSEANQPLRHLEELFSDRHALTIAPKDAGPALIHASLTFFALQGFIESVGQDKSCSHPTPESRVAELVHFAKQEIAEPEILTVVERQLAIMRGIRQSSSAKALSPEALLRALEKIADAGENGPWRDTVISLSRAHGR